MRKLLILLLLPFYLYSNSITFEELEKKALENSFHLQELEESIKMDKNRIKEYKYPGLLNIESSFNPSYSFGTPSNYENKMDYGSIFLSFTPYHSVSIESTLHEDFTKFGISYTPLKSNREIDSIKNSIEINKVKFSEMRKEFNKNLKITYSSLYYQREKLKLTRDYLNIINKKIEQEENKLDKGIGNSETLYKLFTSLLETETDIYNLEIDILQLVSELYKMSGTDLEDLEIEPLFIDYNLNSEAIVKSVDEYKTESEYLFLEEGIRDQRVAIKDTKKGILPNFKVSSELYTEDFTDYIGSVSLLATLKMDFNYLTKIENEQLQLNKLERARIQKIKEYKQRIENNKRKVEINQKRINSLTKSLERSNKTLKAQKFLLDNGDILLEDYTLVEIQNKQLNFDLNEAKTSFILEYLTKY